MTKVTVVVAVLNAVSTIEKCLTSILAQQGVEVELLVFDGESSDGTKAVIDRFSGHLSHYESARDGGIYYAWNKGLAKMSGEWVCFLGADDAFATDDALYSTVRMASGIEPKPELVASKGLLIDSQGKPLREFGNPWNWNRLKHYVDYCHPGMLHSRELIERVGNFSTEYRITADYDLVVRAGPKTRAAYLNKVTVLIGDGGVSRTSVYQLIDEAYRVQLAGGHVTQMAAMIDWLLAHARFKVRQILDRMQRRGV